jgi:hypothetical protein
MVAQKQENSGRASPMDALETSASKPAQKRPSGILKPDTAGFLSSTGWHPGSDADTG